jgi:signal transduction histidine kinase
MDIHGQPVEQQSSPPNAGTPPASRNRTRYVEKRFTRWFTRILPKLPKLRLSHQLIGFFVVVVLFPLLLLSFTIYSINQKAVKKQVNHFTEHTAVVTYEELRLEMAWQQEQARLATEYWLTLLDLSVYQLREQRIDAFFETYPDFDAVAFYDDAGRQTMLFRADDADPNQPALPEALEKLPEQVGFDLIYNREHRDKADLAYSLQIIVPGSQVGAYPIKGAAGAVAFHKRFPYMGNLVMERFETFHNGFVIVDANGTIIAGPSAVVSQKIPREDLTLYQSLREGIVKEYATSKPIYGTPPAKEEEPKLEKVIIKVPNLGWGLIIESPYHIQTKFIKRARLQSVGLVFLCIFLIIILGILYSQGINRNFRQLIKGIKALAEGRYSRKIRLITKYWTPFEIIYLTAEFNRMANKISTAWNSIQKLNQELVYKNQQDLFIAQATQRLHSSLELETVCETAAEILRERPEIQGAMLYLQNEQGKLELAAQSVQQLFFSVATDEESLLPEAVLNDAIRYQRPTTLPRDLFPWMPEEARAVIQPIFYQGSPLGVLVLIKLKHPASSEMSFDDAMVIDLICSQIGVAIHQARQWMQLQRANTQLAKLDEMKSNLIDTVSHELRTPLTNIKGYTSRLIRYEKTLDSETKIKSLKVIKQQADRLSRMVEDLLVIPEMERGEGIRVYPDRVSLYELITRSVAFVQEKANREIRILQCPGDELDILVDPDRMEQVLLNLLDNAIKYSLEDSAVEVGATLSATPGMARIDVFNPCEPIPPEELGLLFAKFKRLDERLTRTTRGTGLGLFITRGLVEAMGGTIWLEGDDGFRVILEVPLFQDSTPPPTDSQENVISV